MRCVPTNRGSLLQLTTAVSSSLPFALTAMLMCASPVAAQSAPPDPRAQYPAMLANSYVSFNVGAVDYLFSPRQLQPGFSAGTIDTPHVTVRVALFGHEFNRFVSVQGAYMRPIEYVAYHNVNGAPGSDHHHVRVNFGSVTAKLSLPVTSRFAAYGESGLAITSRTGFSIGGTAAVTDAHYPSLLVGGGLDYHVTRNWDATAGMTYTPGHSDVAQERTIFTSAGFRYTMRPLPPEQVAANTDDTVVFPHQTFQIEYSTGIGYGVSNFVSTKVPIFWGGNAKVDVGVAPHYERNVFHTRRLFSLDIGTSAGVYVTKESDNRFYTASLYPVFRFTFLRRRRADLYFAYSAAGPTYVSRVLLDGLDTGRHFTFQDFISLGLFAGRHRNVNVGIKLNHFSNGNIFTQNAGVTIPLTFSVGYAF